MYSQLATIVALLNVANCHMFLSKPQRFPAEVDNGPLSNPAGAGSEGAEIFPCQSNNYDFDFARTQIPVGGSYKLQLEGEAVHGGGSCQISLTTDLEPTEKSDFRVIHSVIGGCPARNTDGNLGGDDSSTSLDPFAYEFTIPKVINPGNYTFAWTWFNRVGNREMYMQCAPIEVTSGGSRGKRSTPDPLEPRDDTAFNALPPMFLANIPGVPCSTAESDDLMFPDPGTSVERNAFFPTSGPVNEGYSGGTPDISKCYAPLGSTFTSAGNTTSPSSGAEDSSASSGSGSSAAGPSSTTAYLASSAAAPTYAASSAAVSYAASSVAVSYPASSAAVSYAASSAAVSYAASSAVASPPYPTGAAPAAPSGTGSSGASASTGSTTSGSGSCPSGQVACTADVICVGSNQFGLCNNGCAMPQDLAAGTTCSAGLITKRAAERTFRGMGWYGIKLF